MKVMREILIALIIFGAIFAAGVEDSIAGYYQANQNEDIDEFMNYVDTSSLDESEIEFQKQMVLGIWDAYNTDEYYLAGIEYSMDPSGEYAMAGYSLNATLSGAENFNYELDYVMLLHKVEGTWKVSSVMPYEEYVNFTEESRQLSAIDYLAEEEYNLVSAPLEPANPTFDGAPPQDLSSEIEAAVNSCQSDAYCANKGLGSCVGGVCSGSTGGSQTTTPSASCTDTWDCEWDETCENGFCVPMPEGEGDGCTSAFILLIIGGIAFSKRS